MITKRERASRASLVLGTASFSTSLRCLTIAAHKFSMELRSGDLAGQFTTSMSCLFPIQFPIYLHNPVQSFWVEFLLEHLVLHGSSNPREIHIFFHLSGVPEYFHESIEAWFSPHSLFCTFEMFFRQ